MKVLARFALGTGAAALFAGCGASESPIGARGGMPPVSALAARNTGVNYKVVYSFGTPPDGSFPDASLIDVDGTLYGTTSSGGAAYCGDPSGGAGGTVFSITPSGTEKVLHTFAGTGTDGCNPHAGLIDVNGTFYGTTAQGGHYGCGLYSGYVYDDCGTVFSITPGGKERVLHYFGGYYTSDGDYPTAALIDVKGTLYGTTSRGGTNECAGQGYQFHCGTVFTITPAGSEKVLHDFHKRTNGHSPQAGLVDAGRTLYGTTFYGGNYSCARELGCGTVFRVTTGGKEKTLYAFGNGSDGRFPNGGLIEVKGTLYGTTRFGGSYSCNSYQGCGTVFSITPAGKETVLLSFDNTNGSAPEASLINVKGTLYGTTSAGGAYGGGTVFSISTTGKEKVLHSFSGSSDGMEPSASLLNVKGTLYGTTFTSGKYGNGTVFALTP
jgi:uncharacterized repeat protein (TIGR03803 family)